MGDDCGCGHGSGDGSCRDGTDADAADRDDETVQYPPKDDPRARDLPDAMGQETHVDPTLGNPDPQLAPQRSPGFGVDPQGLDDIEVSREDVTIGEATPEELASSDTEPVADETPTELLERLAGDDHVERRRAALALAERDPDDAPPAVSERVDASLADAARTDADDDVRQFAVEALGERESDAAVPVATELLATDPDPDPWVRAEALVALDRVDRSESTALLEAALDDDHHAVRRNAAVSLFKERGENSLPVLLSLTDDESSRVREWAAHLLGGVGDDRAEAALEDLLDDPSDIVRQTAEHALEQDPVRFRRSFTGALDREETVFRGEDELNRTPDL